MGGATVRVNRCWAVDIKLNNSPNGGRTEYSSELSTSDLLGNTASNETIDNKVISSSSSYCLFVVMCLTHDTFLFFKYRRTDRKGSIAKVGQTKTFIVICLPLSSHCFGAWRTTIGKSRVIYGWRRGRWMSHLSHLVFVIAFVHVTFITLYSMSYSDSLVDSEICNDAFEQESH